MQKYTEITEKLSLKQKITLLTDIGALADPRFTRLGLPHLTVADLGEVFGGEGELSLTRAACSWDTELIEKLVFTKLKSMPERADVYLCPSPKPYFNGANPEALSEDWCLSAAIAKAISEGVRSSGSAAVIDGFWLTQKEVSRLDISPDERALEEIVVAPYSSLFKSDSCDGIAVSSAALKGNYGDINRRLAFEISKDMLTEGKVRLTLAKTSDETLSAIAQGIIIIKGNPVAVENAHTKYVAMKEAVERGQYTAYALEESLSLGEALSDEMIDEAICRLIDFALTVKGESDEARTEDTEIGESDFSLPENEEVSDADYKKYALSALVRSAVLMKNEGSRLPLKRGGTIAVIGDAALCSEEFIKAFSSAVNGVKFLFAKGYELSESRSEALIGEAVNAAKSADSVLVFLSDRNLKHGFSRTLSANQIALLDAMKELKPKLVGIVDSSDTLDMSFDGYLSSVILTELTGKLSALSLAKLLFGEVSPSGKLTKTFYDKPDEYFSTMRLHKEKGHSKVGVFTDYRRYGDSAEVRYPFGYGLGYSSFTYSELKTSKGQIAFRVTNDGSCDATEIAEVYFGKHNSSVARPKRELKAFIRIPLKRGESKYVGLNDINLKVYDAKTKNFLVENGEYSVYVSRSATDVALSGKQFYDGWKLPPSGELLSDYMHNESNIVDKKFYLKAGATDMNIYKRTRTVSIISFAAFAVLAVVAVLLRANIGLLVLVGIMSLAALVFAVYSLIRFIRQRSFYLSELEETQASVFSDAAFVNVDSVRELFKEEFEDKRDTEDEGGDARLETRIVKDLTHDDLLSFGEFAKERGAVMKSESAVALISSLACSRLLISHNNSQESLKAALGALGEFLDTRVYELDINDAYTADGRLLSYSDEEGRPCESLLAEAISDAASNPERAHLVYLSGLSAARLGELLTPYIRYLGNPASEFSITDATRDVAYPLTDNLWFVCALCEGEAIDGIPSYLNEVSIILPSLDVEIAERDEDASLESDVTVYGLNDITAKTRNTLGEYEELWKKLDEIESFVNGKCEYSMGNRFWLKIENYLSLMLALGVELNRAMDYTLASVILPAFMSVVRDKIADDEKGLYDEVEKSFGDDNTVICRQLFNKDV